MMNLIESTLLLNEASAEEKAKLEKISQQLLKSLKGSLKKSGYEWSLNKSKLGSGYKIIWDSEGENPVDLSEQELNKVKNVVASASKKHSDVKIKVSVKKLKEQYRAIVVSIKL
jgi:hypothetical protein